MTRDHDEWRRPWTEGEVAPPTDLVPVTGTPGEPEASLAASPAPADYGVAALATNTPPPTSAPYAIASAGPVPTSAVSPPLGPAAAPGAAAREMRPRREGSFPGCSVVLRARC